MYLRSIMTVSKLLLLIITGIILVAAYTAATRAVHPRYVVLAPDYDAVAIVCTRDTLALPCDTAMSLYLSSGNYQRIKDHEYLIFLNPPGRSVEVFDLHEPGRNKHIQLPSGDTINWKTRHVALYFKNFDSIYVANIFTLYRFDSSGRKREEITIPQTPVPPVMTISNNAPMLFDSAGLSLNVNLYQSSLDLKGLRQRKALLRLLGKTARPSPIVAYPETYHKNFYGALFLNKSYCQGPKDTVVFSFPADARLYVTTLSDPRAVTCYNAGRRNQGMIIEGVKNEAELKTGEGQNKAFMLRDSYGPIYYDRYNGRYLRVAEKAITPEDWNNKQFHKGKSIIILDSHFKIIGESLLPEGLAAGSLFVSSVAIYIQTTVQAKKDAVTFVRLRYTDNK